MNLIKYLPYHYQIPVSVKQPDDAHDRLNVNVHDLDPLPIEPYLDTLLKIH